MINKIKNSNKIYYNFNPYYSVNNNEKKLYNLEDWIAHNSEFAYINRYKNYEPWSKTNILETNLEINFLFEKNITKLSNELNNYYNLNLPTFFWKKINFEWVHLLISYTYQKYKEIYYFFEFHNTKSFNVIIDEINEEFEINYPLDVTNQLNDDNLDKYITNIIFKYKNFKNIKLLKKKYQNINKKIINNESLHKNFLKLQIKKIENFLNKRFQGVYKYNKIQSFILSFVLSFYKINKKSYNDENNIKLKKINDKIFDKIINEIIFKLIPKNIKLINFNELSKKKYYKNKLRIAHTDIQSHYRNLENAYAQINGEHIIYFQHGASYGSSKILSRHNYYEYLNEYFFTWGWNISENNLTNFVPSCIPQTKYKYKKNNKKNKFFFINSVNLSKKSLFIATNRTFNFFLNLREKKELFFKTLSKNSIKNIYFKDHKNNSLFNEFKYLKKNVFNIKKTKIKNFERDLLYKSNLIILPCYDTVLYESLLHNIPTLVLYNEELFDKFFIDDYALLEEANILVKTPELLSERVNLYSKDYDKIDIWWTNEKTQLLVNKFVKKRINSTSNWFNEIINNIKYIQKN